MEFFALICLGAGLFVWMLVVAGMVVVFNVRRPGPYLIAVGVAILMCFLAGMLVDLYYAHFP